MSDSLVKIHTEYIELAAFLKFAGVCETGGEAKLVIKNSKVIVNGEVCIQRGRKLRKGDVISFEGETNKYTVG